MPIACGIIGLPNVGKSTLFNALCGSALAASANYPFCTIEPNKAIVPVPDPRLEMLGKFFPTAVQTPTTLTVVDIAGLVRGAHAGQGLGNQFLSHIREVHAILHVLRCFEDPNVIHVEGSPDPIRDKEIVDLELQLKDIETVDKVLARTEREARLAGDAEAQKKLSVLQKAQSYLSEGRNLRTLSLEPEEQAYLRSLGLLTLKPVLYVANIDESSLPGGNKLSQKVAQMAAEEEAPVLTLCAAIEAQLVALPAEERAEFLKLYGIESPALPQLIRMAYRLLGLVTFFTAGPKEVRAWTVKQNTPASRAAGEIHSDIERGFIRAEVISYADYIAFDGEDGAKAAGKMRLEGKDYLIQDGDVVYFRFAV
ncbi:MAG: redox-regulated ATPase YchF [Bacteroidia bacterium]|nr:redox-regulated ATPase YchF [Bacteroidia bacterium]MCX7651396.1 redox-regulated ATPase YchF [Bacteroidia bacterium]MDW8416704.1 redox-regulated ATPase YchF [Bacteroidia bacterium]